MFSHLLLALTSPTFPVLLLTTLIILALYLTDSSFKPPNQPSQPPTSQKLTDRVGGFSSPYSIRTRRSIVVIIGAYHALLTILYPSLRAKSQSTLLCPHPENLNSRLFALAPQSIVPLLAILVFAPIRLFCFRHLGKGFAFQLATPRRLITTGPYAYVQHPSYTCSVIVRLALYALFIRRDGVAACWLPASVVSGAKLGTMLRIGSWTILFNSCRFLSIRIRDEEAMLKKTFGKQWGDYHAQTKRLIPFVF
ncbi:hypothetical protein AOQ84DRAFT_381169 [Glonium stellatum]|uniref:Protein-S-isoprenylcysteine O-methyltransferase n=1 Tax=Glonium stellatum TaxID=574774 RepID=A0A8E2ET52_9PEZI|nr:hypothetical protein AOQ84DRAFT_381169 [Glonium stellatum]